MMSITKPSLKTAKARARLPVQGRPHYVVVGPNVFLGYRRTSNGRGSWSVRVTVGRTYRLKKLAFADDLDAASPPKVLDYWMAAEAARVYGRTEIAEPRTITDAIERYKLDLERRGGDAYNAQRALYHLTPALAEKLVDGLTVDDLAKWRDSLTAKGLKPSTVNRTVSCLRAALELAAESDPRIRNAHVFKTGLKGVADAQAVRNVILDDDMVHTFVAASYARSHALGVLADVMAVTGARPGQLARLQIADLRDGQAPKLMMPRSAKGGSEKRAARKLERYSVPITRALAAMLRDEVFGRNDHDAPLLRQADGSPWGDKPHRFYQRDIIAVVASIGLDRSTTLYALRHSAIVRMLLRNVPIRLVAALHDTSVQQFEKNYSRFISEHVDEIARAALLEPATPCRQ